MANTKNIRVGADFSVTPIGRYRDDSDYSGELFRDNFLVPSLNAYDIVNVTIDDAEGYGSSFLDEAFGGLIRKNIFTKEILKKKLSVVCEKDEFKIYEKMIWHYINEAKPEK